MKTYTWQQPLDGKEIPCGIATTRDTHGENGIRLGCAGKFVRINTCSFLPPLFLNSSEDEIVDACFFRHGDLVEVLSPLDMSLCRDSSGGLEIINDPAGSLFRFKTWNLVHSAARRKLSVPPMPNGWKVFEGEQPIEIASATDPGQWTDSLLIVKPDTSLIVAYQDDSSRQKVEIISMKDGSWKREYLEAYDPVLRLRMIFGSMANSTANEKVVDMPPQSQVASG